VRDLLDVRRLFKFGVTGLAGFVVDFGTLVGLHSGAGVDLALATLASYAIGGVVHYSLTRFWVFPQDGGGGEVGRVARYLALGGANALATLGIVSGLVHLGVDYRPAKIAAVVLLFFTNYLLTPRLVMTSPGRRTTAPEDSAHSRNSR
jgi:putative flippase GtrA